MAPKKYSEFIVSEPFQLRAKHQIDDTFDWYCSITCPHCNQAFIELRQSSLASNRAGRILQHLRVCTAYEGEVKPAPEKKQDELETLRARAEHAESRADRRHQEAMRLSQQQHDEMISLMEAEKQTAQRLQKAAEQDAKRRHKETLQAIWNHQSDNQPPPIRDQADLQRRLELKRKAERSDGDSLTNALQRICKNERQAKKLRSLLHPDGNSADKADLDLVRHALGL